MKKLRKKPKINLKNKKICANFELETHFHALQNTVVSISEVYISIKHRRKNIFTKNKLQGKKLRHLDEKWLKRVIYMPHSVKKYFSKSKSHSLNAGHDQKNFSRSEKIISYGNFTHFRF